MGPRKGAIAFCSIGKLGLITSDGPVSVTYPDGNTGLAWTGIQLTDSDGGNGPPVGATTWTPWPSKVGDPWSSRSPRVVAYIDDFA